ncbi:MAG: hypothetical protein IKJ15_02790, partial [Lachnospiraceae bacterium]|nr:hypothetical protein [Lachnospiraceae bacterium]
MKKKWITFFLSLGLLMHMAVPFQASNPQPYVETAISQDDPGFMVPVDQKTTVPEGYIGIYTAQDLDNVRKDLDANYILMNDIDLSEYENWVPIGGLRTATTNNGFSGVFDGNGYCISNITISIIDSQENTTTYDSQSYLGGLFSSVNGIIMNLEIDNIEYFVSNFNSMCTIGSIVASCYGSIENCITNGKIEINKSGGNAFNSIGGIAASASKGKIINCFNSVDITYLNYAGGYYWDYIGGIIGNCDAGSGSTLEEMFIYKIENCHNNGMITVS